jgi:hypothetical protein
MLSLVTICMLPVGAVGAVSAAAAQGATATTVPDATPTTTPTPTTPGTEPEDSAPETSVSGDTLVAAGEPDDDIDATTATIAVVGFVLLVGLASWWMVRRNDPDEAPMPPGAAGSSPPSDLI